MIILPSKRDSLSYLSIICFAFRRDFGRLIHRMERFGCVAMTIRVEHPLHRRRFGRNLAVGLLLAAFILVVFGVTVVKLGTGPMAGAQGEVISK